MKNQLKNIFKSRIKDKKFWVSNAKTLALMLIIIFSITQYQQRTMIDGKAPILSGINYSKKTTLVYFWGSWCPICKTTSPFVSTLAKEKDYNIISVALSSGSDDEIATYQQGNDYQFNTINDDNGEISRTWGVNVTPSIYIVDTEGMITHTSTGMTSLWGMRLRLWWASI
ncbi:MAG TPA: protein disulfide oxidoreductase [Oceanospirillales bacterium]|nr:protein disulfide oxidoreductase [Oceanospirillales bacterium]|tara:strand:+ start:406 stop:915 length:510 start_codon:yes stop_codon:yes gene_type:complete